MTEVLVLKSVVSNNETEYSKEIHDDIRGCECIVQASDSIGGLIISVGKTNTGNSRQVMTTRIVSVEQSGTEYVFATKNSVYTFIRRE